jgi:hypothetical protein
MSGEIEYNKPANNVIKVLLLAIAEEDKLVLGKKGDRLIRLHSTSGIDAFFSAIERHDYYIDLSCFEKNQQTIVKYRIRGNSTYITLGIVLCLFSTPFLIIALSALNDNSNRNGLLLIVVSYLVFLGLIMFFINRRQKGLRDRGMKVFQTILAKVEMSVGVLRHKSK